MPRYILIDNHSNFIFADTDTMPLSAEDSPRKAVEIFQHGMTGDPHEYIEYGPRYQPAHDVSAYHVYDGSAFGPAIHDGQDRRLIDDVEARCRKVAVVVVKRAA